MDFSLSEISEKFPSGIVEALEDEGFDNLPALLSADRHDTDGLKLKKSHDAFVCEAAKTLQIQHGEGLLRTTVSTGRGDMAHRRGGRDTDTTHCRGLPLDRALRVIVPLC